MTVDKLKGLIFVLINKPIKSAQMTQVVNGIHKCGKLFNSFRNDMLLTYKMTNSLKA